MEASAAAEIMRARMSGLERAMERVRWFGIALGVYQVFWYVPTQGTPVPPSMRPVAGSALGLLLLVNLAVGRLLRRSPGVATLRRLGAAAFGGDIAAVWTIVWAFSFEQFGATWVIIAILCLEGALRYQMRGALLPAVLAVVIETAREVFRFHAFPLFERYDLASYVSSVIFRVGFMLMIAGVAGAMARNLERERRQAEERAVQLGELARRETAARRESTAFQQVILAGVSADTLERGLSSMTEHVAAELGYERIAVLLLDDRRRLTPIAIRGFPPEARNAVVALGESIAGAVASTGRAEIVEDVRADPRNYPADPSTRSQVTVPIRAGDAIIGVLDVESIEIGAFSSADQARLERLAAQMGLVIENARLLARERATVERMRELDAMKSDFIAIASHELRTPLTAMQGSIKTLRRPDYQMTLQQESQFLEMLDRQADRLARLVEDLLIVSRIDGGGFALRMEPVVVGDVIDDALRLIGSPASRVSVAIPTASGPVITDGQRLGQIVRNLVENALKFSPDDSTVRVSAHVARNRIVVEVTDDGHGIAADEIPHIFDRFHQVGGALRRRAEGFGLGLYITKRLVEALGGTIEVDSTIGVGSTFRVRVPVGSSGARAATA